MHPKAHANPSSPIGKPSSPARKRNFVIKVLTDVESGNKAHERIGEFSGGRDRVST